MELRKVQVTGNSSYIISLPKSWARTNGIKKGSRVFLEPLPDGSLKIIPERGKREKKRAKEVEFSEDKEVGDIIREILAAYLAGYGTVKVLLRGSRREKAREIKEILEENVLGFDVLEEDSESITFYAVIDDTSIKFWDALGKAFLVTSSMIRDCQRGIEEPSLEILKGVLERDQIVDKLYLLGMRQLTISLMGLTDLSSLGISTPAMVPHVFLAAKSVERIADHCCTISSEAIPLISEGEDLSEVISGIKMAEKAFMEARKALLGREKKAPKVAKILEVMRKESYPLAYEAQNPRLRAIFESVRRIISYSLDIAEVSIDIRAIEDFTSLSRCSTKYEK